MFRDETGLSANPHLWSSIEAALDDSAWFILLASPDAAASPWVNRELEHWLTSKSADRILCVVTDGEWAWDGTRNDFDPDHASAVPAALRGVLHDEPRHIDLRWAHDQPDLDLRNARFREAIADLAAPILGIAKDELEGEDVRQHHKTRRVAGTAITILTILLVLALAAGGFALSQRNSARQEATIANAGRIAALATGGIESQPDLSLLLAVEARRLHDSVTTRSALLRTLTARPELARFDQGFGRDILGRARKPRMLRFVTGASMSPTCLIKIGHTCASIKTGGTNKTSPALPNWSNPWKPAEMLLAMRC